MSSSPVCLAPLAAGLFIAQLGGGSVRAQVREAPMVEETVVEEVVVEETVVEEVVAEEIVVEEVVAEEAVVTTRTPREGLVALAAPVPSAPPPTRFTLSNGLRVILRPLPGRSFAAVAVTYRVGSSGVPRGWTGLAHLTEHLMFSGTDVLGEVETYLQLEAAGATRRNAETHPGRTVYYEVLPAAQLGRALFLESHRMARLLAGLTEARVARQREVLLHEGWERGLYGWRGRMVELLHGAVFPHGHPLARQVAEREEDVRAIRLRHVQRFFQEHYAPHNATLAVVGGFELSEVRAEIEARFGGILASEPPVSAPELPAVRPLDHERRIRFEIQHDRDRLQVAWPTPALYAPGDAELDVISTLLADGPESPLRAALTETGMALDVSTRQRSFADGSVFTIDVIPAPGRSMAEVLTTLDTVLEQFRGAEPTASQLESARSRWVRATRLGAEDLSARAIVLGLADDAYTPTLEAEVERYRRVDVGSVSRTLRRWLPSRHRLVLEARANPQAGARGRILSDLGGGR